MECPYCQNTSSRVLESRSTEAGQSIRRRRECLQCKHRFTTYERIEFVPISVLKKDKSKESFDRSKLLRGIVRACEKTEVSAQQIENVVEEIEARLQQSPRREITSQEIGQLVLQYLRELNEVAYIRFASVYGEFKGITDFVETLNQLQQEERESSSSPEWSDAGEEATVIEDSSQVMASS
ncbi:ATP-cone domain protein [Gloeothece citriformis PCC 7424]|uniref:Transcriptional repressor NrdR n=1 Tax=Gloeothece citriformis (strain PCC 7424) TaxID=65393 RepID=NRDR_GLOC7|nr:transcriptional regulator NrdR [Gloeothece citriformis]B7KFG7.1 RecName: Full=Transcriptional repressor NrdR [Gloeothece citriformis PCC 7424]ACK71883.1 ATP-cone domain protein [Gloeothece citriformis PCC 7424]